MKVTNRLKIRFWRFPLWRKSWTEIAYKFYPKGDIENPTHDELEADAYKVHRYDDHTFYVTEYGCFTERGVTIKKFEPINDLSKEEK